VLDLGNVKNLAQIYVNGKDAGIGDAYTPVEYKRDSQWKEVMCEFPDW